jgi:hypothetical protein
MILDKASKSNFLIDVALINRINLPIKKKKLIGLMSRQQF